MFTYGAGAGWTGSWIRGRVSPCISNWFLTHVNVFLFTKKIRQKLVVSACEWYVCSNLNDERSLKHQKPEIEGQPGSGTLVTGQRQDAGFPFGALWHLLKFP